MSSPRAFKRPWPCQHLELRLLASRMWEKNSYCFKPPSLWYFVTAALCLVAQSYPTLCDPMDCSLPGSCVHRDSPGNNTGVGSGSLLQGISPTQGLNPGLPHCRQILYCVNHQRSPRILEWVAYPFSRGSSQPRNQTEVSCIAGDTLPAELPVAVGN